MQWRLDFVHHCDADAVVAFKNVAKKHGEDPDFGHGGAVGAWKRLFEVDPDKYFLVFDESLRLYQAKRQARLVRAHAMLSTVLREASELFMAEGSQWQTSAAFTELMLVKAPTVLEEVDL